TACAACAAHRPPARLPRRRRARPDRALCDGSRDATRHSLTVRMTAASSSCRASWGGDLAGVREPAGGVRGMPPRWRGCGGGGAGGVLRWWLLGAFLALVVARPALAQLSPPGGFAASYWAGATPNGTGAASSAAGATPNGAIAAPSSALERSTEFSSLRGATR